MLRNPDGALTSDTYLASKVGVIWPLERLQRLRDDWCAGLSASLSADGLGCSRSAIIGKWHRLGWTESRPAPSMRPDAQRKRAQRHGRKTIRRARAIGERVEAVPELPPEPIVEADIPQTQRRSLVELTGETCKWPVGHPGDPGFFFCGGPACHGPYCAYHGAHAYQGHGPRLRAPRPY